VIVHGGSTNAVLHLLAIAREPRIDLELDDFDRISSATPLLCDLKPGGRFTAPTSTGRIGLLKEDDKITIDAAQRRLEVALTAAELTRPPQDYAPPRRKHPGVALANTRAWFRAPRKGQ
jgi:dihydroxyacid dehydratase/phosphogluconate dehydratase